MAEISQEMAAALVEQTMELGQLLHTISERDPEGLPTAAACTAFRHWIEAAGPVSTDPRYFEDVHANYDAEGRSNKDLFAVFELLNPYLELPWIEEDDDGPPETPSRTFIPLPIN